MKTFCIFFFYLIALNAVVGVANANANLSSPSSPLPPSLLLSRGVIYDNNNSNNGEEEGSKSDSDTSESSSRNLQAGLGNLWNINEPIFEYSNNVFELNYIFNDMIEDTMISYTIYDQDCSQSGTGGNELPMIDTGYLIVITNDGTPIGDGSGTKGNNLKFIPTPTINQNTIIYDGDYVDEQTGYTYAFVDLCVRVSLSTQNGNEVNFIESKLNFKYVFENGFFVIEDIDVRPPLIDLAVEMTSNLRAFDCTDNQGGILSQGTVIRICIEPSQDAITRGFRMQAIEWFTFSKVSVSSSANVTQEAVVDRVAADDLTRMTCVQGTTQCSVETMLYGAFFDGDGSLVASGLATMQLGTHTTRRRMVLRTNGNTNNNDRALQETVSREFELDIQVKPSNDDNGGEDNNNKASWLNPSESSNGGSGSKPVSFVIIILLIINILTAFLLLFQHQFFKRTWFFLS